MWENIVYGAIVVGGLLAVFAVVLVIYGLYLVWCDWKWK